MIRIALTGSIGMGKSTVAKMFAKRGVAVFDADAEVRKLQGLDGALVDAIETRFPGTTGPQGVDREALGERALGDPDELAALEAIVHPAVHAARARFLLDHEAAPATLFDIPLLFETGGNEAFDTVVVVSAPADVQRERVLKRPGMTADKFDSIIARQMPDAEKRARADFVIDTGGPVEATERQVDAILACLGIVTGR
ncbi:MAG TPA: dephospho-CoA kinase [Sphingomicrobium sp.]|nr:dephospho-CoA kinase [Sphingomicrobium sp.]